ncbi:hypothetical protein C3B79_2727 [Aeromonas hydrophila]|nr:hypothetical protein C3B79_2727 [Aeromonas hydrophila]
MAVLSRFHLTHQPPTKGSVELYQFDTTSIHMSFSILHFFI